MTCQQWTQVERPTSTRVVSVSVPGPGDACLPAHQGQHGGGGLILGIYGAVMEPVCAACTYPFNGVGEGRNRPEHLGR